MIMPRRMLRLITLLTTAGCIVIIGAMGMGTARPRQHLAFASNHVIGQTRLYLMDVPRGLMTRLSDRPTNGGLDWSPDGQWLAFEDALEGAYFRLGCGRRETHQGDGRPTEPGGADLEELPPVHVHLSFSSSCDPMSQQELSAMTMPLHVSH